MSCSCLPIDPRKSLERWCRFFELTIPGLAKVYFREGHDHTDAPAMFFNVILKYYDYELTRTIQREIESKSRYGDFHYFNWATEKDLAKLSPLDQDRWMFKL